MLFCNFLK